jgi:hypothetical protein
VPERRVSLCNVMRLNSGKYNKIGVRCQVSVPGFRVQGSGLSFCIYITFEACPRRRLVRRSFDEDGSFSEGGLNLNH